MRSLRIGGSRVSSGDWLLLGGLVLAVAVVAIGLVASWSSSDTSDERSLGDFDAFARIIEEPTGNRNPVSVAAIEAVVPFPILLPEAVEADTSGVTVYLQPPWRSSRKASTRRTSRSGSGRASAYCSSCSTPERWMSSTYCVAMGL